MYITSSDVADYLGRTLTAPEVTQINKIIPGIEEYANSYMNRTFGLATDQTELFDGGTDIFFFHHPPIDSITSVDIDGVAYGGQFYNYQSYVKLDAIADDGPRIVEIVYAPDDTVPEDFKLALIQWATDKMLSAAVSTGVKSVTVGPASITYADTEDQTIQGTGIPDFIRNVLNKYRLNPA